MKKLFLYFLVIFICFPATTHASFDKNLSLPIHQPSNSPKIAVVYHSGHGHTKKQAAAVAKGAKEADPRAEVSLISVTEIEGQWDKLNEADGIIFGAPTYMGSLSGPFKMFMDATLTVWKHQGWKNKIAAGFTNSASQNGDKLSSLIQLVIFTMQHGMIWVGLDLPPGNNSSKGNIHDLNRLGSWVGAMAQSNIDEGPDKAPAPSDLKTAEHLGARVVKVINRWTHPSLKES